MIVRFDVIKNKDFGFNIHAGPAIGYNRFSQVARAPSEKYEDHAERTDINLSVYPGIGFSFAFFEIEVRYNHGFTDMHSSNSTEATLSGFFATASTWL